MLIVQRAGAAAVLNRRCLADSNNAAFMFAVKNKLGQTAGSDAHHAAEVGHCYTFVETNNIEEFRKAIKKRLSKAIGIQKSSKDILYHRGICRLERAFRKR